MGCVDRIDQIVERAISCTLIVLQGAPAHFDVARAALERMRSILIVSFPDHPALERLQAFLDDLELRRAKRPLH